jgi:hypothetical protein
MCERDPSTLTHEKRDETDRERHIHHRQKDRTRNKKKEEKGFDERKKEWMNVG